jgi:hypothetical protein
MLKKLLVVIALTVFVGVTSGCRVSGEVDPDTSSFVR